MYRPGRQQVYTKWQNSTSEPFFVCNGVRQGAILSPTLFCLYIDVLICRLQSLGVGCQLGDRYFGALGYADDLVLICPSRDGLQEMLNICDKYGDEYSMKFNATKTVCMYMSNKGNINDISPLQLSGYSLKWVTSFKYLGINITPDLKDSTDIMIKRGQFISSVNNLMACFSKVSCLLLNSLFDSYCTSFYGCQTWSLRNSCVHKISTAYNKALRRIWRLPITSHTHIVLSVAQKVSFFELVEKRFCTMYLSMLGSTNPYVKFIAKYGEQDRTSILGTNIDIICANHSLHDRNIARWLSDAKSRRDTANTAHQEDMTLVNIIKELCLCRENALQVACFTDEDIQNMINLLSTD